MDLKAVYEAGRAAADGEPDVRADRVARARERMAEGFYHSTAVREKVAGRLLGVLGEIERL